MKFVRVFLAVNLDYSKPAQEFPNRPFVRDILEKAELADWAAAKFNTHLLHTITV